MSGDVLAQCSATYRLLTQSTRWVDGKGELHDLDAMSVRYKTNVIGFLERRAEGLADKFGYGEILSLPAHMGEMARDSVQDEMERADEERRADPLAWLRTTPLVSRLIADIAAGRGGEDD